MGRRERGLDAVPVGIELLGDQRGEAGRGALARLEVLEDHGHDAVGVDPHEGIEVDGTGRGQCPGAVETDDQGRAGDRCALEEAAAGRPHGHASMSRAARWIAARMRR